MCARSRCRAGGVLPRERADRRLRQDGRRGRGEGRLVRLSTLKRAVPHRGQEDDGAGAGRAARLGLPDVIFYPTGGGTGLIGMWKAFAELEAMGWIGTKRPRMVAVQAAGCTTTMRGRF